MPATKGKKKEYISQETRKFLKSYLKHKDKDESGYLDREELRDALPILGFYPTEDQLDTVIEHLDKNNNGTIEVEELLANVRLLNEKLSNIDEVKAAFRIFDRDGDGTIRLPELLKVLTWNNGMDPKEASIILDELIRKHDTNGDGKFNFEEFTNIYLDDQYDFVNKAVEKEKEEKEEKEKEKEEEQSQKS